ncbi:MAG: sugar ABC transporter ATP-binding protein [Oscillospiraceae bacterium]|nr:sugar ABC transporter ATP-binding protein [Oscillospiraceae bacterium]
MTILEMKHVSKAFGGSQALSDIQFSVEEGEIHALLGENGAGKSTLMNILTGVIPADSGSIRFLGKDYPSPTIQQMEAAGIAFVHQELNVINDLTVADNIFLCRELKGPLGLLRQKEQIARARQLFEDLGVEMDPSTMVSELKTSEKQLLEICRALYVDAKLLILDEPTTALSNNEIEHLFGILRKLKTQGKSFIFISHKMPEIFAIADRYTVLRNGEYVASGNIKDTNAHAVTSLMVGSQYVNEDVYVPRELGDTILELRHYSGQGFHDIDLSVRRGEIVAFTGLAGCGASELMQTMFGALPSEGGHMLVHGKSLGGSIVQFMKRGVAMLPSNRKENSVVPDMTIMENFYLAEHELSKGKHPFIKVKEETGRYEAQKESLHIKAASSADSILALSGGNQQKVFLARWLNIGADVLLFDNPTQGVDVGAKEEIYKLILDFAQNGKTVIINTLEIPEIQKVADRCVVFYEGRIVKIFEHSEVNEHDVMLYSTNAIETTQEAAV